MPESGINNVQKYCYRDYLNWPETERWELIDGIPYNMTSAPSRLHQKVLVELARQFSNFLQGRPCEVYVAPFEVRLPEGDEPEDNIVTVLQPDLLVVCDSNKLDEKGCKGAPDFIIEIVSPSSASLDYIKKLDLYERNKVKEFWIVHPVDRIITVFILNEEEKYGKPIIHSGEEQITVGIFGGSLKIDFKMVFSS